MSQNLLDRINHLLNEEKWTRATIKSYTINNFKELDLLINESAGDDSRLAIIDACEEHLTHSKNSIIALYISGVMSLSRHIIDDSNLMILINIFSDNHKWNIVEYLCERILDYGENKFALRTLAECYINEGEEEKKYEVWERLIKIDYEETEIVKHLAEKYENDNNIDKAVNFYKKAVYRYANKKMFANVKEIWSKLLTFCPDDIDFFYHLNKKVEKAISTDRACQLLEELYTHYKEKQQWDYAIDILKTILAIDSGSSDMRSEIIYCFRQKYSYHSQLEEYIKVSNLSQKWRNIQEAIADFEKHISFEAGNFVFHRSWGIGIIVSIKSDNVVIDFIKKKKHRMSLKMAVNALDILGKEHFWVYKATKKKDELRKLVKSDIAWTLKTIIKSFDNSADMKRIKTELVNTANPKEGILTPGEWTSWSTEARKILKSDSDFGNMPDKADCYMVREKPITYEEKTFNNFKSESGFFDKVNILLEFVDEVSVDSDYFPEMLNYFIIYSKSYNTVNEYTVSSYLIVDMIYDKFPHLKTTELVPFEELFNSIEDLRDTFNKINDSDLKKLFMFEIKKELPDKWATIYLDIFPEYLNKGLIDALFNEGYKNEIIKMISKILENYKDYREGFLWVLKNEEEYSFIKQSTITDEKILVNTIHLLEITDREILNKRNVSSNKKIIRQINNYLFKDNRLENFILSADKQTIIRMISLLDDITGLDPVIKMDIKKKIKSAYPEIKFIGADEEPEIVSRGLIVTSESLESKKRELKHLLDVEIPKNSKEIGAAIELGDLRENAEYKAGKEKQEILNAAVGKLKDDIEKCQVFDPSKVNTDKISFGTKAVLHNNSTGKDEDFTILGPWESDPEKNVISYLAPLGSALLNAKTGEKLNFTINDKNYDFVVKKIKKSDLF